ncbi:hypothetical protein [Fibrella aquatilis]|uniref:Outer membrane protein beta-barrel domain-containing protein n=1 Tax=Fibrella aquatilis TaxID=2817059 RepID=A0A939G450_9BACT|nr:hypothetical protein [Fibrella aquatilis]MBO0929646.1 hypothetical protein [Fibrella aquatilis]
MICTIRHILFLSLVALLTAAQAQDTPPADEPPPDFAEFNRRVVLPLEVGMGFSSQQSKALSSVQTCPQITLINHRLRLGASVGGAYSAGVPDLKTDQWQVYAGPRVSVKLTTLSLALNGLPDGIRWGNVQVFVEHLWGQTNTKLIGGGAALEVLKRYSVFVKLHRDYEHQSTWAQFALAYNFIGQRKEKSFGDN